MFRFIAMLFGLCAVTATSQATLLGRLPALAGGTNYQAYYDTELNITWADADLAWRMGAGAGGGVTWSQAQSWIALLNDTHYLDVNTWRLPITVEPDATCSLINSYGQDYWYGCTGSEMGHLFYVDGITSSSPGPFHGVGGLNYSGTKCASGTFYTGCQWAFQFGDGYQINWTDPANRISVWAVAPGDIVPIPPAAFLFPSALAALGWVRRKTKNVGTVRGMKPENTS